MHEGHRKRMLERLQASENLQDHELMEILLYNAIPRKNTNELAHRLLDAFGSIGGVFNASVSELEDVEGIGPSTAAYLRCLGVMFRRVGEARRKEVPSFQSMHDFSEFIVGRFRGLKEEFMELFCLDSEGHITFCKRYGSGKNSSVTVPAEEINRFLVAHSPHGLVIAHNHPDGPAAPSEQDDMFTAQAQMICSMNNVQFNDHVIVAGEEIYSYFFVGRMQEIRTNYNVSAIIGRRKLR